MQKSSVNTNAKVRALVAGVFFSLACAFGFYSSDLGITAHSQVRRKIPASRTVRARKYSAFPHDTKAHQIQCAACHKFPSSNWDKVRVGAAAFPDITDYPKHESCLNCHRQQFFRGASPVICSICHTDPGPRGANRHPFPNPREVFDKSAKGKTAESDFAIQFSHEKHVDIVSASGAVTSPFRNASFSSRRLGEESCTVCHKTLQAQGDGADEFVTKPPANIGEAYWLKKGTFKSVPIGHTTCFTCHSADSGIEPSPMSCATCHKLKPTASPGDFDPTLATQIGVDRVTLDAWRRRDSSGTFRHEFQSHAELSCDTCHNVTAMKTLDVATKRVAVSSCSMCHVTATVDDGGVMNYEVQSRKTNSAFRCTKCHLVFGTKPIPQSHIKAIVEAGGKP